MLVKSFFPFFHFFFKGPLSHGHENLGLFGKGLINYQGDGLMKKEMLPKEGGNAGQQHFLPFLSFPSFQPYLFRFLHGLFRRIWIENLSLSMKGKSHLDITSVGNKVIKIFHAQSIILMVKILQNNYIERYKNYEQ